MAPSAWWWPPIRRLIALSLVGTLLRAVTSLAGASDSCPAGVDAAGSCLAVAQSSHAKVFWDEMKRRGLQLKLKSKIVEEKAQAGRASRNRTAMILSTDVFYGRAIMKIPRPVLLSHDTAAINVDVRRELARVLFEDKVLQKKFNISGEDSIHMLSLAYPLIIENRDPNSVFREYLDAVRDVRVPVLHFSDRQKNVLKGTTVEGAFDEMRHNSDLIKNSARNFSIFKNAPVTQDEADWALAVIMRHARVVHPHQDARESTDPRMYIIPIKELLGVEFHSDPSVGISFQEEIIAEQKREEEMVLQIARRDMAKGEEVYLWPGRFSNSDMIVRHGIAFVHNALGIGRNMTIPPNWDDSKEANVRKEYAKYNCTTAEAFELRLSEKGFPSRQWVRCHRVSWFLTNGWYSPALTKRMHELDKWPPPDKYTKDDWLSWTQADRETNKVILEYCQFMRQQLRETIDEATANDFRKSRDPMDRLLWHLRGEESRTFKTCVKEANKMSSKF